MFYGTKSLDTIVREVERARDRAEEKMFELYAEYADELAHFETRRKGVTLKDKYGTEGVSTLVESAGIEVYEFDIDSPTERVKCTKRAIKRLRSLEKKMDDWHRKYIMCEDALGALY